MASVTRLGFLETRVPYLDPQRSGLVALRLSWHPKGLLNLPVTRRRHSRGFPIEKPKNA